MFCDPLIVTSGYFQIILVFAPEEEKVMSVL